MDKRKLMDLKETINSVYETDMGDFKRRVITYLNIFLEEEKESSFKLKVKEIKKFIICYITPEESPMEEIDTLRQAILKKLEGI